MAAPTLQSAALVAIGAVPGAWLRFRLVNHLAPLLPRRHWATFGVNVSASFALGLINALSSSCAGHDRLLLMLGTGLLGSLSTFSSFSLELLQAWLEGARRQALLLALASVGAGLLAVAIGQGIGAG